MKYRKLIKRISIYALLILGAFIIQTSVFPLVTFFSSVPNLLLILTFSFGFIYGSMTGMICGLFAGLLMDLFYTGPFGFYSLIFVCCGYVNGIFTRYYYDDFITLPLLLCGANEIIYNLYIFVFRFFMRGKFDLLYYMLRIVLPELVFSLIVTLIVYRVFLKVGKKLDDMEQRRGQNIA